MARLSQLPLTETRKMLTIPHIFDTSCEQLVQRQFLLRAFFSVSDDICNVFILVDNAAVDG